ncbi:hypothetical protein DVH24_029634 [Malus domestica]|uniref:Uncharacterized protein n=1 Tax=Malus domestica TaxID=3750 RepID=A0A498I1C5_MALDO|nr:hypothetical protein DVH24_029634 [Malus domestica]
MGEVVEILPEHRNLFAAPIVFVIVVAFQFFSWWLEQLKKGGGKSATATRLRGEIKDILKEASSLSQHGRGNRNPTGAPELVISSDCIHYRRRFPILLQGVKSATATRLRGEIKDILKEASYSSQPSTFAQAAIASAKEKELANCTSLQLHPFNYVFILIIYTITYLHSWGTCIYPYIVTEGNYMQYAWDQSCVCIVTYTLYSYDVFKRRVEWLIKFMQFSMPYYFHVLTYVVLVCWFWRVPVASISRQLVQPFGNAFLFRIYLPSPLFFLFGYF